MHTINEVRERLKLTERCAPDCPGWSVFETARGLEIQRCDECAPKGVDDEEMRQLPEACEALAKARIDAVLAGAIADAERHGKESFEPDHEIGDLQGLAWTLWKLLPPEQKRRFAATWHAWDEEAKPEPEPDVCCGTCGSPNVQYVCWVDAITREVTDDFGSWDEEDTKFCPECDAEGRDGNTALVSSAEPRLFKALYRKWKRKQARRAKAAQH